MSFAATGFGAESVEVRKDEAGVVTLRNTVVSVSVDPKQGGAVTAMRYLPAISFPLIEDKGAGVAGSGRFFTGLVLVDAKATSLSTRAGKIEVAEGNNAARLAISVDLSDLVPGLSLRRELSLGADESGFRLKETYTNGGAAAVKLRVGSESYQQPEPWRKTLRTWAGDAGRHYWQFTPYHAGREKSWTTNSSSLFWRAVGQYAVGFGYYVKAPETPVEMSTSFPKETGNPAEMRWLSGEIELPAGKSVTVESAVLIDEGGRGDESYPASDRVIVRGDLRRAGHVGEPMIGFGSVVSPVSRKVKMVLFQRHRDWKTGFEKEAEKIAEYDLDLHAGKWQFCKVEPTPGKKGLFYLEIEVLDEAGKRLASGTAPRSLIDGQDATGEFGGVWKRWSRKLPEVTANGSWEEIGRHLASTGKFPRPRKPSPRGAEDLKFYEECFPYYAKMLQGAAPILKTTPENLALAEAPDSQAGSACMGVLLDGPDGPINAYSKERSGSSVRGMGYLKIVPDEGYPLHMYTLGGWWFGYGVNSEGLCTSGATINCDDATDKAGQRKTAEWGAAGKRVAPIGTVMMLATCKDVEEAIAFIENPEAPFSFTGNMLLVDRQGNAAVLESVGILHNIRRYDGKGVFSGTNYSHARPDGLFAPGSNWGWHANGLFREKFVGDIMDSLNGQVSLKDAFWIMETHFLPGGMCQHGFENPAGLVSTCSCIAVSRTSELFITNGPPCTVHYERYRLPE